MGRGKGKGGSYERTIAKKFSEWWSDGERDDIFWRTAGSGAMAHNRRKKGKQTFGQAGDIQATDPSGQPLIDLCTIEIKRGYKDAHLGDVIDIDSELKSRLLEQFVAQARSDAIGAGTPYFLLIVRRDRRNAMIYMPVKLYTALHDCGSNIRKSCPWVRFKLRPYEGRRLPILFGTQLESFFSLVKPKHIKLAQSMEVF